MHENQRYKPAHDVLSIRFQYLAFMEHFVLKDDEHSCIATELLEAYRQDRVYYERFDCSWQLTCQHVNNKWKHTFFWLYGATQSNAGLLGLLAVIQEVSSTAFKATIQIGHERELAQLVRVLDVSTVVVRREVLTRVVPSWE